VLFFQLDKEQEHFEEQKAKKKKAKKKKGINEANYCLTPRNSNPLLASSTSCSNSLPSLALHVIPSRVSSSEVLPLLYAVSNVFFRKFNADMRRGSEWPVKMIKAVRAGNAFCSVLS
jgi:hypothetical protein